MTRSLLRRRAGLAAFAAAAATAAAIAQAQVPAAQTALPPRYRVEIIVFADGNFNPSEEVFEQTAPPLDVSTVRVFDDAWLRAREAAALLGGEATNAPPAPPQDRQSSSDTSSLSPLDTAPPSTEQVEPPFRLLAPEELELTPQYQRLANGNRWRPVLHGGWVQNVVDENRTEPVRLTALGVRNPTGTISLYQNNYMHLRLDVVYQDRARRSFGGASDGGAFDGGAGGGGALGNGSGDLYSLEPFELTPRYRLEQNRQTRSGVLQHFDHPAFGVLVKVTEIPRATASPGAPQRPEP